MKLKILSIDDSRSVQAFLASCLAAYASEFDKAPSGVEALKVLKERLSYYDLIFLDWEMPVLEGPQVFQEMKKMGVTSPVFMLTSRNSTDDITKMLDLGVTDYLMKPFTEDVIQSKLESLFGSAIYE